LHDIPQVSHTSRLSITMANSDYAIIEGLPTPQVYHDLRKLSGMTPPPLNAVPKALANSFVCFLAYERKHMVDESTPGPDQKAVAMGRLLGDKSLFLMLCDVAVHPEHQRRGLGKGIMQKLVEYVDEHAPSAYVSLVAEPMAQKLYPQYGFKDVSPSKGMFRMLRGRKVGGDADEEHAST
jgi:ribosomal protein S18 acetylase RimI-like enzyme